MSKKLDKKDILAFLDSKFSKLDKEKEKKSSKKREEKQEGKDQLNKPKNQDQQKSSQIQNSVQFDNQKLSEGMQNENALQQVLSNQTENNKTLNDNILYSQMIPQNQQKTDENLKKFKEFSLKHPQNYDNELKNKIFFIGQNNIGNQSGETLVQPGTEQISLKQKQQRNQAIQSQKKVSRNTLKQLDKMHQQQSQTLKYETFAQLNKLWKQYIMTLIGKDDNMASICSKIVKADFNGAQVKVVKSKNECMIGVSGLVVKETVRCLFIINEENQVKNLLKQGSVFEIDLGDGQRAVRIWGDNIVFMGSERTKVKFKEKFNFDLY
ncbi:ribonuclease p protein subunit p29 [Stylonychia lemnae]|uniref:Ribonuclease p protein subunit p29 n=1 Tax=Stylonychia lemnae TaxID=5949 RepID=A0A078A0P2_STYLE|nr:ribonuclease p protein subunit p29 [Stylonychia lemnae]|eukprot:CDW75710.1 ribonuclease p protein subunit p29 [Stylonychia lemnae]